MAFVSPTQGHIDVPLSVFAQKFRNPQHVLQSFFPRIQVQKQSDKYWKFGRENFQLPPDEIRAATAAAQRIVQSISTDSYNAVDHSLERLISDEERGNFDPGDPEQWATEHLTDRINLALEKRLADRLSDTAQVTQNTTLAGTTQWSAFTTSDPFKDVQAGIETIVKASGQRPNRLVMGFEVFSKIINHPNVLDRIVNVKMGIPSEADLAALFRIPQVMVAESTFEPLGGGAAGFVFGKHVFMGFVQDGASMMDPSFGKLFSWNAPGTSGGFQVEIGRAAPVSRKSDEVAVHFYYDEKITAPTAGYLIKNAVA